MRSSRKILNGLGQAERTCRLYRSPSAGHSAMRFMRRNWARGHRMQNLSKALVGPGVLEVIEDYRGDTYRAVYAVRFAGTVYVLHVFQKKAKHGIGTPKQELDLIKERLKRVESLYTGKNKGV